MSYEAIGSGSITLNAMSAEEQKNLQEALMNRYAEMIWLTKLRGSIRNSLRRC